MSAHAAEEFAKAFGVMVDVEFVDQFAIGQLYRNPVARATDINADAQCLIVHRCLQSLKKHEEKSSSRLVYFQSHDQPSIGTIPEGVTDDVVDGDGISESSSVRFRIR